MNDQTKMLAFVKALADSSRLKIIGLLAQHPYSVEELAALLGLKSSTVSHHLSKLSAVGLVTARVEGYYNMYELDRKALEATTHTIFSSERMAAAVSDVALDGYDRKVIADFSTPDGRLTIIPAQRKKLEAILRHVVKAFENGKRYPEKQVNEILARFHEDTATLRRELVGYGLMEREGGGGEYWRKEE